MTELDEMEYPINKLLKTLKENQQRHADIVAEAKEGYKTALKEKLEDKLARLEAGDEVSPFLDISPPEDHVEEYDTVIEMLGYTTDDSLVLSQHEFRSYVMDKWGWQKSFLDNASNFSVSGSAYLSSKSW